MKRNNKCITISGGFDSGCLPFLVADLSEYDLIFFSYGQEYFKNELSCAVAFSAFLGKHLHMLTIAIGGHDAERRNFLFLSHLKALGYSEVVMGNRNILPVFDRFKDSNYLYLKIISFLLNIKLRLPITGWTKNKIYSFLSIKGYTYFYNCYKNSIDCHRCTCANCIELKKIKDKANEK